MKAVIELDLPTPQQSRSLKTRQSFVDAGWEILRNQSWESVSITAIAKKAGRSVGVFYQRFGSKDDFLTVLLNRWLETGYASLNSWPPAQSASELIDWYLRDAFDRIRANRYLWRAALQRSWDNPAFWEPFRAMAGRRREVLFERLGDLRGRPLTADETHRLGQAIQVFNSVLNNALLNDPGPLRVDQPEFLPTLEALFMTVAKLELD
jgi:AcrR family transcriptional regulator